MPVRVILIEADTPEETDVLGRVAERFFAARTQGAEPTPLALPPAKVPTPEAPQVLPAAPGSRAAPVAGPKVRLAPKPKPAPRPVKTALRTKPEVDKPFACPECKQTFTLQSGLARHRNQQHAGAAKAEKKQASAQKAFGCDECSFRADSEQAMRVHKSRMHGTSGAERRARQYPHLSRLSPGTLDSSSGGPGAEEDDEE